ncbi:hypothetical protein Tco_0437999 [Tanacetum coccineum]
MRRDMGDMQAELLALREQRRRDRQSGPEARIPDHQDASRDADNKTLRFLSILQMTLGSTQEKDKRTSIVHKGEIKKLEIELWNLKVKGNVFQQHLNISKTNPECTKFVAQQKLRWVDSNNHGLPDNIYGNSQICQTQDVGMRLIRLANNLMDKTPHLRKRQSDQQKEGDDHSETTMVINNNPFKRQNVHQGLTIMRDMGKEAVGDLAPSAPSAIFTTMARCTQKSTRCNKVSGADFARRIVARGDCDGGLGARGCQVSLEYANTTEERVRTRVLQKVSTSLSYGLVKKMSRVIECDETLVQVPYGNETLTFCATKVATRENLWLTVILCFNSSRVTWRRDARIIGTITELPDKGFIRHSSLPWGSPSCVQKENGSCQDVHYYKELNKLTVKNRYPLPRINDLLDQLQDPVFYSKIVMNIRKSPLRVREQNDIPKDGNSERGMVGLRVPVLPFGLTNAPAVQYLGHFIDSRGIHVGSTKIESISSDWASPKTPTGDPQFLGIKFDGVKRNRTHSLNKAEVVQATFGLPEGSKGLCGILVMRHTKVRCLY